MKRILSILLACLMTAAEETIVDLTWDVTGGVLTISGTGRMPEGRMPLAGFRTRYPHRHSGAGHHQHR